MRLLRSFMSSNQVSGQLLHNPVTISVGCALARCRSTSANMALDGLYRRERRALLRYLRRHASAEEAEDLLQDVFVRAAACRHLGELRNPGGYLCRVAKSVLIDRARRRGCRISPLPMADAREPSCAPSQEDRLLAQGLNDEIERALLALPGRTRLVFALHRFDCLTYRQIREQLGISEGAVEYHMMKALGHLRTVQAIA